MELTRIQYGVEFKGGATVAGINPDIMYTLRKVCCPGSGRAEPGGGNAPSATLIGPVAGLGKWSRGMVGQSKEMSRRRMPQAAAGGERKELLWQRCFSRHS
jgi:hypothetical protein